jgi:hypothetical protein
MATLQHCNDGGATVRDAATLRRGKFFFFFFYLTFACCLLNVCLHSFSPCKSTAKKKKKTKDTHNGEFKKTKENDCVNHFNKGIFYARALDLDVAVGSGSTITHGCIRFIEATSVLLSNKFAQQ